MITSMRGCVAYYDLWPWSISSRSFGLGLENRVRSVPSTVRDGFFTYLGQMIISMRRCRMWWPLTLTYIFKVIRPWLRKSCPLCSDYSSGWILSIYRKVKFSVLDRLFPYLPHVSRVKVIVKFLNLNFWQIFGNCNFGFVLLWHGIWYECIVWVIMGQRGVFSERRRSSCSSWVCYHSHSNCYNVHKICWTGQM